MKENLHLLSPHYKPETVRGVLYTLFSWTPRDVPFICSLCWNWGSERSRNSRSQLVDGCLVWDLTPNLVHWIPLSFHCTMLCCFGWHDLWGSHILRVAATHWPQLIQMCRAFLTALPAVLIEGQETLIPCNFDLSPMVKSRQSPGVRLRYRQSLCVPTGRNKATPAS